MEIYYLKNVNSTQSYIKQYIQSNKFDKPIAFYTNNQLNGIGSGDNTWDGKEGNLFFSFVIAKENLPKDLKLQSLSIYFSFILKDILSSLGSKVWLKWPNDFYIKDKKIGGTITSINGDLIYCGIGLNLYEVDNKYGFLDISINSKKLLKKYFFELERYCSWKSIFSKFMIEFSTGVNFTTNINGNKIRLSCDMLQDDGSLLIDNKKVFSLR